MSDRPNIIWIFADQMRGHTMGCAGDSNVRTPNLDRLAAEGVRFESACSTYPLCIPFRFTALTGEYAHSRWIPALNWRMSPAERTIAHEFSDAGYHTVYVGKWHLNGSIPLNDPSDMNRSPVLPGYRGGFEEWHGFNLRNNYYDTCCFHGDDPIPQPLDQYQTDGLFDIAVERLEADIREDEPFFMVLSVEAPHPPHQAPEEFLEAVDERELEVRPNWQMHPMEDELADYTEASVFTEERAERDTRGYYAQIDNLDVNMGRMLDQLERSGLMENTVVMFFSDHGEMLGSHGLRAKQVPYEESINIPFIAYGPSVGLEGGRVLEDPICTEDIYPTTMSVAGRDVEESKPGLDLTSYMRGDVDSLARSGVYLELVEEDRPCMSFFGQAWRGYRTRRHKYTTLNGHPWHLFDLHEDPFEQNNLVNMPEHEDLQRELHHKLMAMGRETGYSYPYTVRDDQ